MKWIKEPNVIDAPVICVKWRRYKLVFDYFVDNNILGNFFFSSPSSTWNSCTEMFHFQNGEVTKKRRRWNRDRKRKKKKKKQHARNLLIHFQFWAVSKTFVYFSDFAYVQMLPVHFQQRLFLERIHCDGGFGCLFCMVLDTFNFIDRLHKWIGSRSLRVYKFCKFHS